MSLDLPTFHDRIVDHIGIGKVVEFVGLMKEIPQCYEQDLRIRLKGITDLMLSLPNTTWTKDSIYRLLLYYKEQVIDAHRDTSGENVSDIQIDSACEADQHNRIDYQEEEEYLEDLERIMLNSMRSYEAKVHWYKARVYLLKDELAIHDNIQSALDKIPEFNKSAWLVNPKWGKYIKSCFNRLDTLRRQGSIGYQGWYMFNKELMGKIGRINEVKEPKYDLHSLPDRIEYYEDKLEALKQEQWNNKPLVTGCTLETEELEDLIEMIEAHEEAHGLLG